MLVKAILPLLATAHLAAAHFGLTYPSWQVDTLKNKTAGISQWNYPCRFNLRLTLRSNLRH